MTDEDQSRDHAHHDSRGHHAHTYVLSPERLWDGEADSAREGLSLIVSGNRVESVAPSGQFARDVERLELPGCTLIPGLIDSHVHYADVYGALFLAAGVTTVRETGNDLGWILQLRAQNAAAPGRGPRIVCCGFAHDGEEGIWSHIVRRHADAGSLQRAIREHVEQGVDAIKLYASLDAQMLRAGVDEARAHGMSVLAHLNDTPAEAAADAGLDEIEHFSRCDVAWGAAVDEDADDTLIDRLLARDVIMNPTLSVWDRFGRAANTCSCRIGVAMACIRSCWTSGSAFPIGAASQPSACAFSERCQISSASCCAVTNVA